MIRFKRKNRLLREKLRIFLIYDNFFTYKTQDEIKWLKFNLKGNRIGTRTSFGNIKIYCMISLCSYVSLYSCHRRMLVNWFIQVLYDFGSWIVFILKQGYNLWLHKMIYNVGKLSNSKYNKTTILKNFDRKRCNLFMEKNEYCIFKFFWVSTSNHLMFYNVSAKKGRNLLLSYFMVVLSYGWYM